MRFATILDDGRATPAIVRDDDVLPLMIPGPGFDGLRQIIAAGPSALVRIADWVAAQSTAAWLPIAAVRFGPVIPDPGAIYTIGLNYDGPGAAPRPERPLVYGKAATAVAGHLAILSWDRQRVPTVDPEVELGVVIGAEATDVPVEDALDHVFGYTIVNDVSSRDAWLDGDQWLLGKSLPGFAPVGPVIVTADELDPSDLAVRCAIGDLLIQDGRTSQMRTSVAAIVSYLSRHLTLRPGDLIAAGTPVRLPEAPGALGPDRHLEPGDVVTTTIEGIGALTTIVA